MKTILVVLNADGRTIASSETFIQGHIASIPHRTITLVGNPGYRKIVDTGEELFNQQIFSRALRWLGRRFLALEGRDYDTAVVRKFIESHDIDCVLAEYGHSGADILDACTATNTPLVVHFHGYDAYRSDILLNYSVGYKKLFQFADAIVAVSKHMQQELQQRFNPKNDVIHNSCGANLAGFDRKNIPRIPNQIVSVGRLTPKKGFPELIGFFHKLLMQCPDAKLVIVGDGEDRHQCEQLIIRLDLADKVTLFGWAEPYQALHKIAESACFVLNSVTPENGDKEGTPVVVLEAMALATPIVATAHGGITDLIEQGQTGYLYAEHDAQGFVRSVQKVLSEFNTTNRMIKSAQQRAQQVGTAQAQNLNLVRIINRVIVDRSKPLLGG
ncbi:glycosyltransferase family 4 protein [Reinekea sp.]|jgi:glycosyltransferase involved in cell wall biosynthesis|uniref:glycosyltransferase family 4 protein n=1 Tax=Reinekea sp. TaxID=1970455 RepID=UPI002A80003E|nr:glycosyltransferase family 4 protein [Reinekea sp.]